MTTPSGRPFAPRTCRRSLDEPLTGSQKVVNHDISQVPARATRGVDRVEGRARGWSSGECCSPEVAVGMEHTVRRAIPRTLSLRPATRVVARAVRHSQESTFSDESHFVLPPPSLVAAPPFTFEELVSFCGILLLFWVVGKLAEKIGLPSVRHHPLPPLASIRRPLTPPPPCSSPLFS